MMTATISTDAHLQLSYRVIGSGPRDVFLIHGWMVSGAVYDEFIAAMVSSQAHDLRLIVIDQRGTGASSKPESGYTLDRYAADVLAVADAVGSRSFVAVGHSMGGQIAQWLAAHHPDRVTGMVLLCPVPASGVPLPDDARNLFRNSGGNRGAQQTILGLACKQLDDATRDRLLDDAAGVSTACVQQAFDTWTAGGFSDRLSAIRTPTLVVATDDPFLPPAFLQAAVEKTIAFARLAILPGPGHYVQAERPRETAALVQSFLAGLRSDPA